MERDRGEADRVERERPRPTEVVGERVPRLEIGRTAQDLRAPEVADVEREEQDREHRAERRERPTARASPMSPCRIMPGNGSRRARWISVSAPQRVSGITTATISIAIATGPCEVTRTRSSHASRPWNAGHCSQRWKTVHTARGSAAITAWRRGDGARSRAEHRARRGSGSSSSGRRARSSTIRLPLLEDRAQHPGGLVVRSSARDEHVVGHEIASVVGELRSVGRRARELLVRAAPARSGAFGASAARSVVLNKRKRRRMRMGNQYTLRNPDFSGR